MKHIKLYESMEYGMQSSTFSGKTSSGSYVFCIGGDNGSAVGMLDPQEEKMLADYLRSNPGSLTIQKFPLVGQEGDFVVLTSDGEWKYIKVGDRYYSSDPVFVYPILGFGQMFVGFAGAQITWKVDDLSNILEDL